jgi:Flp pilus assembly protein TadG
MRERLAREDGQVIPLLAAGLLVVLLGFAALVVDVGHAYLVQRQLQATADAAAIAASDSLPTVTNATATARQYGPDPAAGGKNQVAGVTVTQTVTPFCLRSVTYCYGNTPGTAPTNGQANGVVVTESASVPTQFGKLFGYDSINVSAKATACALCGTPPLDIALVIDRTGSMSDNMTDLRNGLTSFAQSLDPALDWITLLVLPPLAGGGPCSTPSSNVLYPAGSDSTYTVTRLSHDYLNADRSINYSSTIVQDVACLQAAGATHYKQALIQAYDELQNHGGGRPGVQKVIIFESDGAANTVPASYLNSSNFPAAGHTDDVLRPCGSALDYANNVLKPAGVTIYTVAYATNLDDDCYQAPHNEKDSRGRTVTIAYKQVRESTSASATLSGIASPGGAVSQSQQGSMAASFQQIATKLMNAKLVPDSEGP